MCIQVVDQHPSRLIDFPVHHMVQTGDSFEAMREANSLRPIITYHFIARYMDGCGHE